MSDGHAACARRPGQRSTGVTPRIPPSRWSGTSPARSRCTPLSGVDRRLEPLGTAASGGPGRHSARAADTGPQGGRHLRPEPGPSPAVLICDRDIAFCEALKNFLLAAGYCRVDAVASAREALPNLRRFGYGCVLIGLSQPFSRGLRLAGIAKRRQRDARILFLLDAKDQPLIRDASRDCLIKEYVFSNLLELM